MVPLTEVAACTNAPPTCEIRPTRAEPHASGIRDAQMQGELRQLAAQYVEQAGLIESKEKPTSVTGGL